MDKKYELTDETINIGHKLYRIKALKNFGNVKKGDLGGFIQSENNLSQKGDCWVYHNAKIQGNAMVCDNAQMYDNSLICGNAKMYDNSVICDNARIYGDAKMYDNAKLSQEMDLTGYVECNIDLSKNLIENIRCQTGLIPVNNKIIAYKQVDKNMCSFYNKNFKYKVGEIIEVEDYDDTHESCAKGLHFSNANYWNNVKKVSNSIFLIAEIHLNDIITIQRGKIRCKKATILESHQVS